MNGAGYIEVRSVDGAESYGWITQDTLTGNGASFHTSPDRSLAQPFSLSGSDGSKQLFAALDPYEQVGLVALEGALIKGGSANYGFMAASNNVPNTMPAAFVGDAYSSYKAEEFAAETNIWTYTPSDPTSGRLGANWVNEQGSSGASITFFLLNDLVAFTGDLARCRTDTFSPEDVTEVALYFVLAEEDGAATA